MELHNPKPHLVPAAGVRSPSERVGVCSISLALQELREGRTDRCPPEPTQSMCHFCA